MAIYKKLATIQSQVKAVGKNQTTYNYDYVTGDKLLSIVRPMMDELHLLLMPEVVDITTTPIKYPSYDKRNNITLEKMEVLAVIKMRMNWVDAEDGETLTQEWAGTGMNNFDKGFGSALTYGERYYLLKLFHLQTDRDDVDYLATERDEAVEKAGSEHRTKTAPKAKSAPKTAPVPAKKALKEDTFIRLVEKQARGAKSPDGQSPREYMLNTYDVSTEKLHQFDELVKDMQGAGL